VIAVKRGKCEVKMNCTCFFLPLPWRYYTYAKNFSSLKCHFRPIKCLSAVL
jgi:hypothetical protein